MTSYRQSMKDTLELMNLMREAKLLERDLTPDEEKRREEIAKDLPDDDFKKRYGDKWMQVKMATATNMVKKEELGLDERMKLPRQLIDKNKEVMLVKKNKVIVVDKKDQDKYMKQGWTLAEETDLEEGKMKDLVIKGQDLEAYAKKSGGIDKNDMMKVAAMLKKGDKSGAVKYAMKLDTDPKEYILNLIGEETELDEKVQFEAPTKDGNTFQVIDRDTKGMAGKQDKFKMQIVDKRGKVIKDLGSHASLNGAKGMAKNRGIIEEVELDEGKMQDMWQKGAKSVKSGPFELMRGKSGVHAIMQNGKKLGDFSYDSDADNFVANMKGMKGQWTGNDIDSLFTHLQKVHKEEVDLDEDIMPLAFGGGIIAALLPVLYLSSKEIAGPSIGKLVDKLKKNKNYKMSDSEKSDVKGFVSKVKKEKPSLLQKAMKKIKEEVELEEASAAADARRAMRRDPDMKQRAFSKDDDATDDDKKAASKNIMMQMRKAQSLNGKFDVEFQDGKKVKIPAKMAIAVQQKYNSMRKPSDKEKFQAKVAKSYRDMLNALKESAENQKAMDYKAGGKSKAAEYRNKAKQMVGAEAVSPAQQAAIAISKKERGEKPKKESILDRIDRKIKENKNG